MGTKKNLLSARRLGSYYTPHDFAAKVVSLAVSTHCPEHSFHSILEPSCGDGSFLDALDAFTSLNQSDVIAMDIDSDAVHKSKYHYPNMIVLQQNFFDFWNTTVCSEKRFDLIVGNPPWVCYQTLSHDERQYLQSVMRNMGLLGNKLSNLYVPFVAGSVSLLNDDGIVAFILPADLLWNTSSEELRKFLIEQLSMLTIILFEEPFPGLEQSMLILIGQKRAKEGDVQHCRFRIAPIQKLDALPNLFMNIEVPFINVSKEQKRQEKWTSFLLDEKERICAHVIADGMETRFVPFSQVAEIKVGITTGKDSFFVVNSETIQTFHLEDVAVPLVTPKGNNDRFILMFPNNIPYEDYPRCWQDYIKIAEDDGIHKNYKCSQRKRWYVLPECRSPHAFFSYFIHKSPKFLLSDGRSLSTSTLLYVNFLPEIDARQAVASFFNSVTLLNMELSGRIYGEGALQITPGDMRTIKIPNPERFSLKLQSLDKINTMIMNGDINDTVSFVDRQVLINTLGLDEAFCNTCRCAWNILRERRLTK